MVALFAIVLFKPHNAPTRKLLYILYAIGAVLYVIFFIAFAIYAFASDYEETLCADATSTYSDYQTCMDAINLYLILALIVAALIVFPCQLCVLQILYWGWKEQEHINEQRQAGDIYNTNTQNHHLAPTTGPQVAPAMNAPVVYAPAPQQPYNATPDGAQYQPVNNMT